MASRPEYEDRPGSSSASERINPRILKAFKPELLANTLCQSDLEAFERDRATWATPGVNCQQIFAVAVTCKTLEATVLY
jgi:hypothetical protein